ncbi:MAG: response regulator [Nanoarchaeota archaeon]|nr:response regulator [Nanoarchaeota archaeon]
MYSILIVDDEDNLVEMMRLLFSHRGYRAMVVTSADEAKRVLAESVPDVVLTDVFPYGSAVMQEVQRLRASDPRYKNLESAVMSGSSAQNEHLVAVRALSTSGLFFQKGTIDFDHLVRDITRYLENRIKAA